MMTPRSSNLGFWNAAAGRQGVRSTVKKRIVSDARHRTVYDTCSAV